MRTIKLLFILLSLFLNAQVYAATWKEFGKGPIGTFYYDTESITGETAAKKINIKLNYSNPLNDGTLSKYTENLVDCKNLTYQILNSINYPSLELQGTGKIIQTNSQPISTKPQTIGERLVEVACNPMENKKDNWIEVRSGTNDSGELYKVFYAIISGNESIKKINTLSNFTDKNGNETSRKFTVLINCETKELFYISDITYDKHWGQGNTKINQVKSQRFPLDRSREERNLACSTKLAVLDQSVTKEWDVKDKAIGSKSRTQVLQEYKFKWSNGKIFSMDEVGNMMVKCAGYSISLYELQPRMSILQNRGGKEFLAQVDTARGDQVTIVNKLYGEERSNEMLSRAGTLMGMMIKNPGGIESNSREAKDCLIMTKTAVEMLNTHFSKLPPLN